MLEPVNLKEALIALQTLLKDLEGDWIVGGSCGLLLQGMKLEKPPRDLDLYADLKTVRRMNERLAAYAEDELHESSTALYHSYLSHFQYKAVPIEIVGDFTVRSQGTTYQVNIHSGLKAFSPKLRYDQGYIYVMPLAHELVFNILRSRADRYQPIADMMKQQPELTMPALSHIIRNNEFADVHLLQIGELLGESLNLWTKEQHT